MWVLKLPVMIVWVIFSTLLEFLGWACVVAAGVAGLALMGTFIGYMNGSVDDSTLLITIAVDVPVMVGAAVYLHNRDPG